MILHGGTSSCLTIVRLHAVSSTISGTNCPSTIPVLCQTSTAGDLAPVVTDFSQKKTGSPGQLTAIVLPFCSYSNGLEVSYLAQGLELLC